MAASPFDLGGLKKVMSEKLRWVSLLIPPAAKRLKTKVKIFQKKKFFFEIFSKRFFSKYFMLLNIIDENLESIFQQLSKIVKVLI